jgi:hypothetical protein
MLTKVLPVLILSGPRRKLANLRRKGLVRFCRRVQPPLRRLWPQLPESRRKLIKLQSRRLVSRIKLF